MAATGGFDAVQLRILGAFVDALEDPAVRLINDNSRDLWRQMVHQHIPGLTAVSFTVPRQEFLSIVNNCATIDGGMDGLVAATCLVTPVLEPALSLLLAEWKARLAFPGPDWAPLRRVLEVPVSELGGLVDRATDGLVPLPEHCATPWEAFVHLADRNSHPGGLLPAMAFLEHTAALCPEVAAGVGELRAWNDHFARQWHLTGPLTTLRTELSGAPLAGSTGPAQDPPPARPAGPAAPVRPLIRIYVKVEPDRTPQGGVGRRRAVRTQRYYVSACVKYTDSSALHRDPHTEPRESVTRSQLPIAVAELLTHMTQLRHSRAENAALELFLPAELLNEPVEWWDRDPTLGFPNSLLSRYREILLHSLERVQRPAFHNAWRARWAHWRTGEGPGLVHECDPETLTDTEHLALLDAKIGRDDDVVGMVLSRPPHRDSELGLREMSLALDLGVPIVVYHRDDPASEVFRSMIRETLANEGLSGLPERAQQWKSDVAVRATTTASGGASAVTDRDVEAIRSMSMIWDDPELLLEGGQSAPATFVGGTE
ncbi:VMAP-C domain-containing protein [Streptomyces sp. NPDC000229]|uniref:VMAP-C domain-containing protein n=1 Tax=Streptomyces sp. NPDC000229 TaxID=3154247 RepID=UPI00331EACFB